MSGFEAPLGQNSSRSFGGVPGDHDSLPDSLSVDMSVRLLNGREQMHL
jgi:hypothetical protein